MERRTFLKSTSAGMIGKALGAGGLLSALNSNSAAAKNNNSGSVPLKNGGLKPLSNDLTPYTGTWGDEQLRHLLRRCMFGLLESDFLLAQQKYPTMDAIVTQLLACQDLTNVPVPAPFASWLGTINSSGGPNLLATECQEIVNWWFDQMMQESLSIRQKMTLMWTNHFVIGTSSINYISAYAWTYLITCMTNALGNFKTFAQAISIDPAMLVYLNGNQNSWTAKNNNVNENYAREVMELFTLGITFPGTNIPNYTQNDVEANAQALTGWTPTVTAPFVGQFNSNKFDPNPKTFLGQTGNFGLTSDASTNVIDIIFQQPTAVSQAALGLPAGFPEGYTAAYWACQTIYKTFVYYNPEVTDAPPTDGSCPQGLIRDAMARLMLNPPSPYNPFDIAPVMQALLTSDHFYSDEVIGAQIKSPCEYMGSLVREFGLSYTPFVATDPQPTGQNDGNGNPTYTDSNPTLSAMTNLIMNNSLGQQLLNPPNVAGWPGGENWLSAGSFQNRQLYSLALLGLASGYKGISALNPETYMDQVPNVISTTTEAELFPELEDVSLAFTLVPLDSDGIEATYLTKNPSMTVAGDLASDIPTFAVDLATLPEFQLF